MSKVEDQVARYLLSQVYGGGDILQGAPDQVGDCVRWAGVIIRMTDPAKQVAECNELAELQRLAEAIRDRVRELGARIDEPHGSA